MGQLRPPIPTVSTQLNTASTLLSGHSTQLGTSITSNSTKHITRKHPQLRQLWLNHHRHLQSRRHLMDQATAVRKALGVTGVNRNAAAVRVKTPIRPKASMKT